MYIERRRLGGIWRLDTCKPFIKYNPSKLNGYPELYGEIDMRRDYYLFGILAGVRNGMSAMEKINGLEMARLISQGKKIAPIGQARGIPDNLSTCVKSFYEMYSDNHSPSWGLFPEMEYWQYIYKRRAGDARVPDFDAVVDRMRALERGGSQTRAVFWFDS